MENIPQKTESKASIIETVKTPLGLAALVVLLIEGILTILATKATGVDFTILVIAMPAILLALIVLAFFVGTKPAQNGDRPPEAMAKVEAEPKHDVFISSPMAAFATEEAYKQNRQNVLKLADSFRKECKFQSIVFTGKEIASMADFEAADLSARDDIKALKESKFFVLHYSEKIVSSVLFEAGVALALRKPSLYLVKNRDDLPFLMREAEQAFPGRVKIYEGATVDAFIELVQNHRERLFPSTADANSQ